MLFRKVVVGISGGVDSAVAALLLKNEGFEVHGVFMKNWDFIEEGGSCSSADAEDAAYVCKKLGIPFRELSFVKEYWNEVFTYMLDSYEKGFIPNPDIMCNKRIKFSVFFNYAVTCLEADAVATGHYARNTFGRFLEKYNPSENASLLRAVDDVKDQTFFLSQIPQAALRKTMFPIGDFKKANIKQIAIESDLAKIARKKESMGICFVGSRNFKEFIKNYIKPKPGKFLDLATGKVIGSHEGLHLWVEGQKIKIPGLDKARYVMRKCDNRDIIVGPGANHPALLSYMFLTGKPHWISKVPELDFYFDCEFLFQHIKKTVGCRVLALKNGGLFVVLEKPLTQMNSGQFAVFYDRDYCLGSAEILKVGPSYFSLGKAVPKNFREYHDEIENNFLKLNTLRFKEVI